MPYKDHHPHVRISERAHERLAHDCSILSAQKGYIISFHNYLSDLILAQPIPNGAPLQPALELENIEQEEIQIEKA